MFNGKTTIDSGIDRGMAAPGIGLARHGIGISFGFALIGTWRLRIDYFSVTNSISACIFPRSKWVHCEELRKFSSIILIIRNGDTFSQQHILVIAHLNMISNNISRFMLPKVCTYSVCLRLSKDVNMQCVKLLVKETSHYHRQRTGLQIRTMAELQK